MMLQLFDQTILSDRAKGTHGDRTRACVRTILQDELPDLPHLIDETGEAWNDGFFTYLEEVMGYELLCQPVYLGKDLTFLPRVLMAGAPPPRTGEDGKPTHMVIWDRVTWRCLHDPHPSRSGLSSVDMLYWLSKEDG